MQEEAGGRVLAVGGAVLRKVMQVKVVLLLLTGGEINRMENRRELIFSYS